jgi:hypothetical protein
MADLLLHRSQPLESNELASGLEYPLDTQANVFVLDELTSLDLIETSLNLLREPLVIGKQPVNGFPH